MRDKDEDKIEDIQDDIQDDIVIEPEAQEVSGFSNSSDKKLKDKLKQAVAEKQEYLDGWQRAKADLVNAKKEFEEQRVRIVSMANENMANEILPVLDSFDMAFSNKEAWEAIDENWRKGVEHIHNQLLGILRAHGVEEIQTDGVAFDPVQHISSEEVDSEGEKNMSGIIARTTQKGYKSKDGIIRPARVVVYR